MAIPDNPLGRIVVTLAVVFTIVDLVFIVLRLWARRLKRNKLDTSDYLIIVAWLVALADTIRKIIAARWGVGLHYVELAAADPTIITPVLKITWAGFFLWLAIVTPTKLSILFLYRSLFRCMERFVVVVYCMMALVTLYFIGFSLGNLLQCTPIAYNWDKTIPGGKCLDPRMGFLISGSINLALDVTLVIMPAPIVWGMQNLSTIKKIGVTAMFGLGTFICLLVGLRFKYVVQTNVNDFTHDGEVAGIWGELELYLGIISACLPLVSPPLAAIREKVTSSYHSYRASRGRSSEDGSDSSSLPKSDCEKQIDDEVALNSWPGYTRDYAVEVVPPQDGRQSELSIHCQSDWQVKFEDGKT